MHRMVERAFGETSTKNPWFLYQAPQYACDVPNWQGGVYLWEAEAQVKCLTMLVASTPTSAALQRPFIVSGGKRQASTTQGSL